VGTNQKRDADMDRLLRDVLKPGAHPQAGECPDAAVLAAFVEGGLSRPEQSALDQHIARCRRCQESLAIIGRDQSPAQAAPERRGWFRWVTAPRLKWLVPITAAATIAVFFFATRPLVAPGDSTAPGEVTRLARATPEAERGPAPAASAEAPSALPVEAAKDAGAKGTRDRKLEVPARVAEAVPAPAAVPARQVTLEQKEVVAAAGNVAARADVDEKRARVEAGPVPSAPLAPPVPAPAVAEFAAKSETASGAAAGASRPTAVSMLKGAAPGVSDAGALVVVTAPDGSTRWRLTTGGRIWRSIDAGANWRALVSGTSSGLLAGSAPSATLCWVVGTGGTVLRSEDGEHWERRPFPLAVDLVAVRATSGRAASVVARDGRQFETLDGGATWSSR
jgi:hypothetical protein